MEATVNGLIHSFKAENGFGLVELDDGRSVRFDVMACVEEPLEGQEVRVVLGVSRSGEPRAVLVEPSGQPASTRPASTLEEALRRLKVEGLALELDEYELKKHAHQLGLAALSLDELVPLLSTYYADEFVGARRRHADSFIAGRDGEPATEFALALAELLGTSFVAFSLDGAALRSIDDIVDAYNEELRATGDARRIVPLAGPGPERAYYCMALSRATRLSAVRVLAVRWDRPHLTPSEPPPRYA